MADRISDVSEKSADSGWDGEAIARWRPGVGIAVAVEASKSGDLNGRLEAESYRRSVANNRSESTRSTLPERTSRRGNRSASVREDGKIANSPKTTVTVWSPLGGGGTKVSRSIPRDENACAEADHNPKRKSTVFKNLNIFKLRKKKREANIAA